MTLLTMIRLKNISVLLLPLVLILLNGCSVELEQNRVMIVKGNVQNSPYSKISLRLPEKLVFSKIDSLGNFFFAIDSHSPLFMRLQLAERGLPIYSEPGNIDSISCVEEFRNNLQFSGDNSIVNRYLLKKILNYESELRMLPQYYLLDALSFCFRMDSLQSIFDSDFKKIKSESTLTQKFADLETAQIMYKFANLKLTFSNGHKFFTKNENTELPREYFTFLEKLDLNNPNLLNSPEFLDFARRYIKLKMNNYPMDSMPEQKRELILLQEKMKLIPALFSDTSIIEKLLFDEMKSVLKESQSVYVSELFILYDSLSNSTHFKEEVSALYREWKALTKGKPAPEIICTNLKGNSISLKDFRGYIIVLDIWASWCNPCRREFPLIKEMTAKYKNKNIVFISISVDDDREKWKKTLTNYQLEGIQLFANNGWESSVIKEYNINTIPRFILIDQNGKIINTDAPSPTKGLSKLLDELI